MNANFLSILIIVFFTSLVATLLCRQLRLPAILGYLTVGALIGPHALGLTPDTERITALAEFGIVFLMFTVGLEFSLSKLFALRYIVFVIGGLQVSLTIFITTIIGKLLDMSTLSALVVGSIAAMSSTALVVKQLKDQLELHSIHGRIAVGILLFQDLAVIPIIILIGSFVAGNTENLNFILLTAFLKGIAAILFIFLVGRWILKPLFRFIANTRVAEFFTSTVLLVTLSAAWITNLLDLSYALGAFLAGIMLAETEFRHQIEVEIRPFRDILLGLFFISVGMLANIPYWYETALWIFLLLISLILGKMILIFIIGRLFGYSLSVSLRTGLILAQGSEFGFAVLTLALTNHLLPPEYGQVVLAALLISIALAPIFIYFNQKITNFLLPKPLEINEKEGIEKLLVATKSLTHHVIICGYGRVGQHIGRLLDKVNFPYIALDLDPELIHRASLAGERVLYGNPTHPEILEAAGIEQAKVLMISFNDINATTKILSITKQFYPTLPVLIRCRDELELKQLKELGATKIIAEIFEESLTLSHHLLNLLHIPATKISDLLHEVRSSDYNLLHKVFIGEDMDEENIPTREQLKPIFIPEDAYAVHKQLKDLHLKNIGVEVIALRREGVKSFKPHANNKICPNDIWILYGTQEKLEAAERVFLEGSG